MGALALLAQRLINAEVGIVRILGTLTVSFLGFFAYEVRIESVVFKTVFSGCGFIHVR
jgi:hypothetical protein